MVKLQACVSYFCAIMIKFPYKKQLKEKRFALAYGDKGVESILTGKARYDNRSRNLADHIFIHIGSVRGGGVERERAGCEQGYII